LGSAGNREIDHIEFEEFVNLIEEIKEAGWNQRVASPNEPISKIDLMHVFAKVDVNGDQRIDTREMKQACKYLCKVFGFEKSTERELVKYMKEYDADGDGTLDFGEFQTAMRFAQHKKNNQIHKDEVDVWE